VVVTFYKKEWCWPLVRHGLELNKDKIGRVFVMNDDVESPDIPPPTGVAMEIHNVPEKRGWGAAERCNAGAALVTTPYFLHIDGDMMLGNLSVARSLYLAEPELLLACQVHNTTKDAEIVPDAQGDRVRATTIHPENRPGYWRKPLPLNLRHGHYLAHTESFRALGGHDLTPPWDTEYHSIDYCLAAGWLMKYGKESFEFGGGAAFHVGGIYEYKVDEAESPENKRRVREVINKYIAQFHESDDGSYDS
jgi:hypothetical protein